MRLEVELIDGGGAGPGPATDLPPVRIEPRRRRRVDRFDIGVLAVFAAVSLFVLVVDLARVVFDGAVWTGTDGVYIVDQMQYLAWIRDASHHVLVSNLFVLRDTPADYFQPAVVVSGALTALGVPIWLSLLLWKPVAVVGFFFAVRAYARRSVAGRERPPATATGNAPRGQPRDPRDPGNPGARAATASRSAAGALIAPGRSAG